MVNLSKEQIYTIIFEYKNDRKSANQIGRKFNVSPHKILKLLREHNVEVRKSALTETEKKEIIERYKKGESSYKLSKEFSVAKATILNLLKNKNIERREPGTPKNVPKEDREIVVERFINGESAAGIAKTYNCYSGEILRIIHESNVEVSPFIPMEHEWVRLLKREKDFDEDFFHKIDNEKKAYWLGFIAGDGCVRDTMLVIKLKRDDSNHLEKCLKDLKATYDIKHSEYHVDFGDGRGPNKYRSATISICSIKLCDDLRIWLNLDGKTCKTYDLRFPKQVSPNLYKHIIRGFIDSDGSIQYNGTPDCKVAFYGTIDVCTSIRDILVESCGVSSLEPKYLKNHLYEVRWSGTNQILKILDWLYDGATTYLDRKYQQYRSIESRKITNILEVTSGSEIRYRRTQLGFSRKSLAQLVGCSISYINGIENEYRTRVSKENADKLFHILGLNEDIDE